MAASESRTALVTGGAGFIGSHLVDRLLAENWRVRILDNLSTGCAERLDGVRGTVEFLRGDIRDLALMRLAARGIEVLFHLAALPSVARSVEDPWRCNEVNVVGTLNALLAARSAGVRRFVFASSSSVYGESPALPKSEETPPNPLSPYAVSKLAGEQYCRVFYHLFGLETVCLRFFNVFGPRQDPTSPYAAVIPQFLQAARNGSSPLIHGDGRQSRDFTYAANVVEGLYLAATHPNAPGGIFNIACGSACSIRDLLERIERIVGRPIPARFGAPRPGDIRHSLADISLAQHRLGYRPAVDLDEGLRRTWAWFAERP